ncbi:MAG: transposase family protein, partial [Chloroflexota bacterium]|nr:transposase family protein [Chloroflexota bacterium]
LARKPIDVLDMTSLMPDECQELVPAFEAAFQAHMAVWRLDGKPRTARRFTTYKNCPLPTPEDRLLFMLVYLKTNPLQVAHGIMFGLPQGKANQWIHVLLPVLRTALRQLGDAPSRSLAALAQRLAVPAAAVADATAPLFAMMAPSDASRAPKMPLNRKAAIAARKSATM